MLVLLCVWLQYILMLVLALAAQLIVGVAAVIYSDQVRQHTHVLVACTGDLIGADVIDHL